jgi:hypothetical protein
VRDDDGGTPRCEQKGGKDEAIHGCQRTKLTPSNTIPLRIASQSRHPTGAYGCVQETRL